MTYIQKKRIRLILLGLGVFALWIYLLGAMTSHAKWVEMDVEYEPVQAFYYESATLKIDKNTGIVSFDVIFHFTPNGAKQFIVNNKLDPEIHKNLTYATGAVEFNHKKNEWRLLGSASYDNNKKLIAFEPGDPNTPFQPVPPGSVAAGWFAQIRKDYGL